MNKPAWGALRFFGKLAVAGSVLLLSTTACAVSHLGDPYGHLPTDEYTVFVFSQTDPGAEPLVDPQVMAVAPDMNIRALQKWSTIGLHEDDYNFRAISLYHDKNIRYIAGGTAAALFSEETSAEAFADMATRDSLNELIDYGWGGRHNGSLANPAFRDHLFNYLKVQIDAGVDGIFLDEVNGAGCQGGEKWSWNGNECFDDYFIADFNRYLLNKYPNFTANDWKSRFGMTDDNLLSAALDPADLENNFNYREYLAEKGFQDWPHNPENPLAVEWGRIIANRMIPLFGGFLEEAFNRYWYELVVRLRDYARISQGREIFITSNGIIPFVDFNSFGQYNWNVDDNGAEANYVPVSNGHLDGAVSLQSQYQTIYNYGKAVSNDAPMVLFLDWPTQMMTDYFSLPANERMDFWQIYVAEAYANGLFYALHLKTALPDIPTAQQLGMVDFFAEYAHFYRVRAEYYHHLTPQDVPVNVANANINSRVWAQPQLQRVLLHLNNHNYDREIFPQTDFTVSLPLEQAPQAVTVVSPDFPGRKSLPFVYQEGTLTLTVDSLVFYNLIDIQLAPRDTKMDCDLAVLQRQERKLHLQAVVKNHMESPSKGWTSCVTFNRPVTVERLWNAGQAQQFGNSLCVNNASFNGVLAPQQNTQFGALLESDERVEVIACHSEPLVPKPSETLDCSFQVKQTWRTGFVAEISVTNVSDEALPWWDIKYRLGDGLQVSSVWNASNHANPDNTYTAESLAWNSVLPANATRTVGIRGTRLPDQAVDIEFIGGACRVTPEYDFGEWQEGGEYTPFDFPEREPNTANSIGWSDGLGGNYGLYLPAAPADAVLPVIMFLHGYTGTPLSAPPWIAQALNAIEPVAVFIPQRSADEGASAWGGTYDQEMRPAMQQALLQLNEAVNAYGFDATRIYVYGESMGAEGVFKLLADLPGVFAGAVAVAGYTEVTNASEMTQTPLWILHGNADTVNPVSSSQNIYEAILNAGGGKVRYTEYEGLGHVEAINEAVNEPGLPEWLLAQPLSPVVTDRDDTPSNPNATANTKAVLSYLADLSQDPFNGAIVGQNCGHTADIYNDGYIMSFSNLVGQLHEETGKWVGMIGVDYEHNRAYKPEELSQANEVLIDYWNAGGLISVGFSPINPWLIDETDLEGNPGTWEDTRTHILNAEQINDIDLNKLLDPDEPVHTVWRRKLDRIANALLELQRAGVVVLFKPLQEQNGSWFWWGSFSYSQDPAPYIHLYRDMFDYFTEEKGLNNLLWVFAPSRNEAYLGDIKPQMWAYPGNDRVDVLGPTLYNDETVLFDYEAFVATGKPLGMSELGPHHNDNEGMFDNRRYIDRIRHRYPGIAYWINWHDWENGDGTNTYMSIIGNQYYDELMNHPDVITRERISWNTFLQP